MNDGKLWAIGTIANHDYLTPVSGQLWDDTAITSCE
jgi:hypothetical protein